MGYSRCGRFLPEVRPVLFPGGSLAPRGGEGDFAVVDKLKKLRNVVLGSHCHHLSGHLSTCGQLVHK